jgi:signal transduction histidine kinase
MSHPSPALPPPATVTLSEQAGFKLKQIRERLGLTLRPVEEASLGIADTERSSEYVVFTARLNQSHEIRTPMNGVIGMTELALETELTQDQRHSLNIVKASADSLLTVINDILEFSKIEAGKLELETIDFKMRDSIDVAVKALALRAQQKGLELDCCIEPDEPEAVMGDPGRLRPILPNLLGNSLKFT